MAAFGRLIWPCDIDPNATWGKNIKIPHAVGIVVGATAVVEDDVLFMSGVVIGSKYGHNIGARRHANIGRGVMLGANCVILGAVSIGECAKIGAGSVITKDVPPYATVVGNNQVIRIETVEKTCENGLSIGNTG